jgi:ABC-type multidrug transport system ATPase subunit
MSNTSNIIIETRNLSKRFKDVQAVNSLNMKVRKGEIYGFLGPNGAGKTTTIKMMMGLTHPSAGEVLIGGKKVSGDSVSIKKDIGYLPEVVAFYDNLTPLQTLHFFCELKGVDKSIAEPLLKEVGLENVLHRKVGTFSKGMNQLLGIAQTMIGKPSIYILDESMAGLDARWVKVVREKIKMLNRQGATILFSSHILTEVQNLCNRVAIINKGKLIAEDTVSNLSSYLHIKPRLEIIIAGLNGRVPDFIFNVEGVENADAKGDTLFVTCDTAVRIQVITALKEKGLNIQNFKTIEPTLEEAFVKLISKDEGDV